MSTAALALVAADSARAACQFEPARIGYGFESTMKGEANSGKPCGFALTAAGPAGASGFRVVQPPHHGVAGVGESYGMPVIGYRSVASYRGPDEFVVTFVGGVFGQPAQPGSIRVQLDVK